MTSKIHGVLQLVLGAVQAVNVANVQHYATFLPEKYAAVLIFVVSGLQGGLAIYNHYFNPNGTTAALPDPSVK